MPLFDAVGQEREEAKMLRMRTRAGISWPSVLRVCLSPFPSDAAKMQAWAAYSETMECSSLSDLLATQNLQGLMYSELTRLELLSTVPNEFQKLWRQAWVASRFKAAKYLPVLRQVLSLVEQAGVPALVFKGPVLVEQLYGGQYGARTFSDIDMAIHHDQVAPFLSLLSSECAARGSVEMEYIASRAHLCLDNVDVEIHWDLSLFYPFSRTPSRAKRQQGIWDRSCMSTFTWGACRTMSPEDTVLHLAAHTVLQHDLKAQPYRQIIDFARVLTLVEKVPAERLIDLSHEYGYPTALLAACEAATVALEGTEQHELVQALRAFHRPRIRRLVLYQLRAACEISKDSSQGQGIGSLLSLATPMAAFMDGFDNRLRFLRQLVMPSRYVSSFLIGHSLTDLEYWRWCLLNVLILPAKAVVFALLAEGQCREWGDAFVRFLRRVTARIGQ